MDDEKQAQVTTPTDEAIGVTFILLIFGMVGYALGGTSGVVIGLVITLIFPSMRKFVLGLSILAAILVIVPLIQ